MIKVEKAPPRSVRLFYAVTGRSSVAVVVDESVLEPGLVASIGESLAARRLSGKHR